MQIATFMLGFSIAALLLFVGQYSGYKRVWSESEQYFGQIFRKVRDNDEQAAAEE